MSVINTIAADYATKRCNQNNNDTPPGFWLIMLLFWVGLLVAPLIIAAMATYLP